MEISGEIIAVLPERSGVAKASGNEWKVASYVLQTQEQYPKKMMFEVFGSDKISQFAIKEHEVVNVSFDVDAREYQGKWYNSIRAWKVTRGEGSVQSAPVASVAPQSETPFEGPKVDIKQDETGDLPF